MSYFETFVLQNAPATAASSVLAHVPGGQVVDSFGVFLRYVATARTRSLFVLLAEHARHVEPLLDATLVATDWGRSGLRHFIAVGACDPLPQDIVSAFRKGCDGYIPLPATLAQLRRGLPREFATRLECAGRPQLELQTGHR